MTVIISTLKRGGGGTSPFPTTTQDDARIPYVIKSDLSARDNIPEWKRLPYMSCDVISEGMKRYQLGADTTISGQVWTPIAAGADVQTRDEKNQPSGYVGLNAEGYVDPQYIRSIYAQDYFTADNETERLNLSAKTGDICNQLDTSQIYIKKNNNPPPTVNADWADITPTATVALVNGQTGIVIIDIDALLAYGDSLNQFNTAVGNAPVFTDLSGQVANNQADIANLYDLVNQLITETFQGIPLWDSLKDDYDVNNSVLFDTGTGIKSLYRCKAVPAAGVDPTNTDFWERIGDYYTRDEIASLLADKADLIAGKVPVSQIPAQAFLGTIVVQDITERNDYPDKQVGYRFYVIDASDDPLVAAGGAEYVYSPATPEADPEGFILIDSLSTLENWQLITINEATKTDEIVLSAAANIIQITLAADLTSKAKPSGWTGWIKGRVYKIFFIKKGDYGFDGSDCVAANNIGYDADIDPFDLLLYIDNIKQRTIIGAIGFPDYGQFGRMIETGSNYTEP